MNVRILFFFSVLFLITSCKRYYTVPNFDEVTESHKTVAVLPFEILMSGYVPAEFTPEMIEQIEVNESKAFQVSFFNKILSSTRRGKNPLRITLQHYAKTLEQLEANGISIRDSWNQDPEKMATLLGVDAVVKARIEKQQYFSDALSAGIEIGETILDILGRRNGVGYIPNNNKNVKTDFALVNSDGGTVLWSIAYQHEADWRQRSDELVDNINHRSARHFPYRVNN